MVNKPSKSNYRQYYKEYYGIEFGSEFAVHHIDKNRENNDISNLILLPKELHSKFHFNQLPMEEINKYLNPDLSHFEFMTDWTYLTIKNYITAMAEIRKWVMLKQENYRSYPFDMGNIKIVEER